MFYARRIFVYASLAYSCQQRQSLLTETLLINHHRVPAVNPGASLWNQVFLLTLDQGNQKVFREIQFCNGFPAPGMAERNLDFFQLAVIFAAVGGYAQNHSILCVNPGISPGYNGFIVPFDHKGERTGGKADFLDKTVLPVVASGDIHLHQRQFRIVLVVVEGFADVGTVVHHIQFFSGKRKQRM